MMTDKEQMNMFNEVFTRLRKTEELSSNLCVRLDLVVEQMKTSNAVTDKFLEALDKRRISDEAREAKFWKAIAIIGGALIALALGKEPAKMLAEQLLSSPAQHSMPAAAIFPHHDDKHPWCV